MTALQQSTTLRMPTNMTLSDAATRAANARKDEIKLLATPLGDVGSRITNSSRRLLKYMEYNYGALTERELVEALGNQLELLAPGVLQSDANLFIGYARLALHTSTPHEALVYLLTEISKITGRRENVLRVWSALEAQFDLTR
ncbi:hypothetical protein D3C71_78760 [compost metagenome]